MAASTRACVATRSSKITASSFLSKSDFALLTPFTCCTASSVLNASPLLYQPATFTVTDLSAASALPARSRVANANRRRKGGKTERTLVPRRRDWIVMLTPVYLVGVGDACCRRDDRSPHRPAVVGTTT